MKTFVFAITNYTNPNAKCKLFLNEINEALEVNTACRQVKTDIAQSFEIFT